MRNPTPLQSPEPQTFTPSFAREATFTRKGLRSFWEYRDLGVNEGTHGHVRATVLRAIRECPEGGTGWHYHELDFQMYYVLKGTLRTLVEGQGELTFSAGDSWLQPPRTKHNVVYFSADLELLELIAPAEYGTETCDPAL
ncbi:MAG TPA: cupin domain-containing protein [bacterium]|nr:cupin domain-containing protein [bacterium]